MSIQITDSLSQTTPVAGMPLQPGSQLNEVITQRALAQLSSLKEATRPGGISARVQSGGDQASGENNYREVLRNLSVEQLAAVEKQLQDLSDKEHATRDLAGTLNTTGQYVASEREGNLYSYYALAALRAGLISLAQFATTRMYDAIQPEQSVSLFTSDGAVNPLAQQNILDTLGPFSSEDFIMCFFDEMRKCPKSEQQYFIIASNLACEQEHVSIIDIFQQMGFEQLRHIAPNMRMVPSFSMMQKILELRCKKSVVTMCPAIGMSTLEGIANSERRDRRDCFLPFPTVENPTIVDYRCALQPIDVTYHDFFHAFVLSHIPPHFRKAFIRLAEEVLKLSQETSDPELAQLMKQLHERCIDMECEHFMDAYPTKQGPLFGAEDYWLGVEACVSQAHFIIHNSLQPTTQLVRGREEKPPDRYKTKQFFKWVRQATESVIGPLLIDRER